MGQLTLTIIGTAIVYWIYTLFQKKKIRERERQWEAESRDRLILEEKIEASYEEENEIMNKIQKFHTDFHEEVYKELHKDLVFMFGDDYRDKFKMPTIPPKGCDILYPGSHVLWATRLLLAHKGKVRRGDVGLYGLRIGGIEDKDWQLRALQRIEHHLTEAYPEAGDKLKLYMEPDIRTFYHERSGQVRQNTDYSNVCGSKFTFGYWANRSSNYVDGVRIYGRRLW